MCIVRPESDSYLAAAPQGGERVELVDLCAAAFGVNVERLRKAGGLTKTRFAEMLGIGRPLLNKIEGSAANPRISLVCKMAEALEVTPQDLLELPRPEPERPRRLTLRGHLIPDDGSRLSHGD